MESATSISTRVKPFAPAPASARAELVEAPFFPLDVAEKERPFDKLWANRNRGAARNLIATAG
ncbi:MAG: hypothetical protein A3E77_07180 [Sphingopyxis sp. RIFCSPHIGHO2_12_FULL_65_19]|nr:MAG: hypothetical protein A3E77_07180 [Sphingopyxis sp. RIFCSPHIGHO2_12_FULL_65_19]